MYVGFDIGGTMIKYGLVSETGGILEQAQLPTPSEKEAILVALTEVVADYQTKSTLKGIGISAPGVIRRDGFMTTAGAIRSLYRINLKEEMMQRCQLPVFVENDANAAAIAEKWLGNAQNYNDYICLVLGTGVGGGVVINGQIYRGAHGMAGEFGFMLIDALPATGNLEAASVNWHGAVVGGLYPIYNQALRRSNPQAETVKDARVILARAKAGERIAQEVLDRYYQDLAVTCLNLLTSFDPEAILIGGGISANEDFMQGLLDKVAVVASQHEAINYLQDKTMGIVQPAKLRNNAGLIGAVYQIHQEIQEK